PRTEDGRGLDHFGFPEELLDRPEEVEVRKGGKRRPRVKVLEVVGIPGVEYRSGGGAIRVNAVLAREVYKRTGEVHEWVYVTTLPLGRRAGRWWRSMGGGGRWRTRGSGS
ncbi:MAG: hypothetical protein AB1503_10365, partial [Bacillota bacterium]